VDFQVKIQGQRIELGEIEAALQQHPAVRATVVKAVGKALGEKRLAAYVVPKQNSAPGVHDLRSFLQEKLPEHMLPSAFVMLDHLPLTPSGKVDRMALPHPTRSIASSVQEPKLEGSTLLTQITQLVSSVLDIDQVHPDANLMSLGANSIDMIRIGNQLEKRFGSRPGMAQLFRLQTTAALAGYYEQQLLQSQTTAQRIKQAISPDIESLLAPHKVLLNPEEREAFKNRQPGLRREDVERLYVQLVAPEQDETLRKKYAERRSYRKFALKPIPFEQFSKFLSCLYQISLDGKPKYLYASPGGLYPTQTYLHFKPGRVNGIAPGIYYYHPVEHRLVLISGDVDLDRSIHVPFINTPIFDEAAFSIFLIAQLAAIMPVYGGRSLHFATLEAGVMAHLLEDSAPKCGIGLCQIGSLEFERIRPLFELERSHVLIHSLLGGLIDADRLHSNEKTISGERADIARMTNLLERIKQLSKEEVKTLLDANRSLGRGDDRDGYY
jgi:SagB-type dehydrogenase family enzyme